MPEARVRQTRVVADFLALPAFAGGDRVSLQEQLYRALRGAIVSGALKPGTRLPSTRALSEQMNLSRNTVLNSYLQLWAEGYLAGRQGSGTYVTNELPDTHLKAAPPTAPLRNQEQAPRRTKTLALSERGKAIAELPLLEDPVSQRKAPTLAFCLGTPALDAFPVELWSRLIAARWKRASREMLRTAEPGGVPYLREAIANYLSAARGVRCCAEQVLVVAGSQQAMALTAQVTLNPGDAAWVEDPGYPAAHGALAASGARLVPVAVDAEGMDVRAAQRAAPKARLAVVTPAYQFPMGVTLSPERRAQLLDWAAKHDAWIFEDDYDSEFRYAGRPPGALQGMDENERVIFSGTFSKVLLPSIRLGYLVVPRALLPVFVRAKLFNDVACPTLDQYVLGDFLNQGHFARHVRRMRRVYGARQNALVASSARELRGALEIHPTHAGMHITGLLQGRFADDDRAISAAALDAGVHAVPLSFCRLKSRGPGGLVLGFACATEREIREGVLRLKSVFKLP
jgi:GntR family transcriptional regulator / MocR family aminotransferase